MIGIATILLLVSTAACQSVNITYPLSIPLPNGATDLSCQGWSNAVDSCTYHCCTNEEMLSMASRYLCDSERRTDDLFMALIQHDLNFQRDFCRFRGFIVVAPQLRLTANATANLKNFDSEDEKLRREQTIFVSLQILGGHIGLPILLIVSILLRRVRRDITFFNFCFTWVFSGIVFSIGLYRRGPASLLSDLTLPFIHSDQECSAQAALVTGVQVMTDTSMCALIIQLWLDFRTAYYGPRGSRQSQWTRVALLAAPYVSLLVFSLPVLQPGTQVFQLNFYCLFTLHSGLPFFIFTHTIMLIILIVTFVFDACIIRILYHHWRFFRLSGDSGLRINPSIVLRVVLFCIYRIVVAIANGATIINMFLFFDNSNVIPVWVDMLQAATPLFAFFVFGTSGDFLEAFVFWRKKPRLIPTPSDANVKDSDESVLDITRDKC